MQNGGSAIYNPSIALVKIKVETFKDAAIFQSNLKRNASRSYHRSSQPGTISSKATRSPSDPIPDRGIACRRSRKPSWLTVNHRSQRQNQSPCRLMNIWSNIYDC